MAEAQEADGDDEIFVYMGGEQVVPRDVVRVRIDKSVKIIPREAFKDRYNLIYAEFHDGIETIEGYAFYRCFLLRGPIRLLGVKIIEGGAFAGCSGLIEVQFGDKLETIGSCVFYKCTSLNNVTMPSGGNIGNSAFGNCEQLTDLDLPEGLDAMGEHAFSYCHHLQRIAIPLKRYMIGGNAFYNCSNLASVDLVGGIHKTVASLHLESWRNEMKGEMNRINQVLPNTCVQEKTLEIQQWIRSVIRRLDHYKAQHKALLKEATTLLELALGRPRLKRMRRTHLGM